MANIKSSKKIGVSSTKSLANKSKNNLKTVLNKLKLQS